MKKLVLIVGTFLLTFTLTSNLFAQKDPKAEKIIETSKKKFNGLKSVTADFSYTLSNPNLENEIKKNGKVFLSGDKYSVDLGEEMMVCNAQDVWVYLKEDCEVTISTYDPEESISIDRIYKYYDEETKSKYEGKSGSSEKITLFMLDDESDNWKVELWVNASTSLIDQAKLYSRTGSIYTYNLSNIKTNVAIEDSKFVFDENQKCQGGEIYVNDLR